LIILLFLIDGLKIEQMRLGLADYWHFWFGLLGVLWAFTGRASVVSSPAKQILEPDLQRSFRAAK